MGRSRIYCLLIEFFWYHSPHMMNAAYIFGMALFSPPNEFVRILFTTLLPHPLVLEKTYTSIACATLFALHAA